MMSNQKSLTPDEIEVRVWGFVVVAVTLILCFIVVALLYSVTFVTQPIKSIALIDQAYTKMLNDIVLLIVGLLVFPICLHPCRLIWFPSNWLGCLSFLLAPQGILCCSVAISTFVISPHSPCCPCLSDSIRESKSH